MAANIISALAEFLTPSVIDKMASATGLAPAAVKRAAGVGVPAILSGVMDIIAKPQGARRLANAIARQPLDLRQDPPAAAAEAGPGDGGILATLLGGERVATLAASMSKFLGLPETAVRALLQFLMPAIVTALGRQQATAGTDSIGVLDMLVSQKDLIKAAVPEGLSSLLQSEGFYDQPATASTSVGGQSGHSTASSGGARSADLVGPAATTGPSRLLWMLPLLAAAGFAWYFLLDRSSWDTAPERSSALSGSTPGAGSKSSSFLAAVPSDALTVRAYQGRDVYNSVGDRIGTVTDLVVGSDGKVAAVISVGRFLGLGDKEVAIALPSLQRWQREGELHFVVDALRDELRLAPVFELRRADKRLEAPGTPAAKPPASTEPSGAPAKQ